MNERSFAARLAEELGHEDLRLVLSVFESDVARLTATLAATAAAGDTAGFRRAAHGLTGAAGAVGAVALEQACRAAMAQADVPAAALSDVHAAIVAMAQTALEDLARFIRTLDRADCRRR